MKRPSIPVAERTTPLSGALLSAAGFTGCLLALASCASSAASAHKAADTPSAQSGEAATEGGSETAVAADDETAAEEESGMPTRCWKTIDDVCLPNPKFIKRLCDDVHQDVALVMFRPDTPWTRLYLRGKTEAWNASGGASVQGELAFDEEVLVVRYRKPKAGGIQVGDGGGSFDALRWNGSCVTLSAAEVTRDEPPRKRHSRVEWRWMGDSMQEALREDAAITEVYRARRKECKGQWSGSVSQKCEKLDAKLVDVIVEHVRAGGSLGEPQLPE